jgi:hypothetical protein
MLKQMKARKFLAYTSVESVTEHLKALLDIKSPLYVYTLPKLGSKGGDLIKIFAIKNIYGQNQITDITKQIAFVLDESIHTDAFAIPQNSCNSHIVGRLSKALYGNEILLMSQRN